MNRLILVGNGFDLGHGMKTSYNNFILWYLTKCFASSSQFYEDELLSIYANNYVYVHDELAVRTIDQYILEHDNCVSIKIFYYENLTTRYNNYTELTEEISRHFKDKRQMRLKIVPFNNSSSMPQKSL